MPQIHSADLALERASFRADSDDAPLASFAYDSAPISFVDMVRLRTPFETFLFVLFCFFSLFLSFFFLFPFLLLLLLLFIFCCQCLLQRFTF